VDNSSGSGLFPHAIYLGLAYEKAYTLDNHCLSKALQLWTVNEQRKQNKPFSWTGSLKIRMPLDGLPSLSVPLLVTGGDLRLELARIRYDICDNVISSKPIFVERGGQESLWVLEESKNEQNRA
jgi:hypothetical protein